MLFDEVDKIKSWKAEMDSETLKKEQRLQENRRVIEAQRKAIQELQVCELPPIQCSVFDSNVKQPHYTWELQLECIHFFSSLKMKV